MSSSKCVGDPVASYLRLPVEIHWIIATFLTPAEIAMLAQTNRSMRLVFGDKRRFPTVDQLQQDDAVNALALVAREYPDKWVCADCPLFHKLDILDTHVDHTGYAPAYMHVQIALKLTRLRLPAYNSYLQNLLKPVQEPVPPAPGSPPEPFGTNRTEKTVVPRIITDDDGKLRYIVKYTWRFSGKRREISGQVEPWFLTTCPHLSYYTLQSAQATSDLVCTMRHVLGSRRTGFQLLGMCDSCRTDYVVAYKDETLYVTVFRDFGTEESPLHDEWRSQQVNPNESAMATRNLTPAYIGQTRLAMTTIEPGPVVKHRRGEVKRLWHTMNRAQGAALLGTC